MSNPQIDPPIQTWGCTGTLQPCYHAKASLTFDGHEYSLHVIAEPCSQYLGFKQNPIRVKYRESGRLEYHDMECDGCVPRSPGLPATLHLHECSYMTMLPMLVDVHRAREANAITPTCGHHVDVDDFFCRRCGTPIGNSVQRFARDRLLDLNILGVIRQLIVTEEELTRHKALQVCA